MTKREALFGTSENANGTRGQYKSDCCEPETAGQRKQVRLGPKRRADGEPTGPEKEKRFPAATSALSREKPLPSRLAKVLMINLQLCAAGESADERPGAGPKERCRPPETTDEVSSGPETKRGSSVRGPTRAREPAAEC